MPDISMCSGEGCKLAGNCYRKTATPNEWRQSWFAKPLMNDDGTCDHLMSNSARRDFRKAHPSKEA